MECIDGPDGCQGLVMKYYALSGSGERYPRCDQHYSEYVMRVQPLMDEIRARYPDTDVAPDWFDPTYAGEHWDEDY